jgi:TolB-like protein
VRLRRLFTGLIAAGLFAFPAAAAAEPIRVAMLPIVVHAASGESDYLSKGLAEMLSARLEQAGGIEVIRLESNSRATTNAKVAISAGKEAEAEYVVFGSFTQFGSGASLDVRCARVGEAAAKDDPESRQVFIQSGELGEIIPRLGDLSGRIVQFLKGSAVAAAPREGGAPAPAGSPAVGELERRVEALERAVFKGEDSGSDEPASERE